MNETQIITIMDPYEGSIDLDLVTRELVRFTGIQDTGPEESTLTGEYWDTAAKQYQPITPLVIDWAKVRPLNDDDWEYCPWCDDDDDDDADHSS